MIPTAGIIQRQGRGKPIREKLHETPFHACSRPSRSTRDPLVRLGQLWTRRRTAKSPPPQFESESVEVKLGDHGGTVTLITVADGDFTLDGEAFAGGAENPVEGEGGRQYVLTLAEGTWTAAFLPSEVVIDLGTSGATVTLATTEAGGWTRDGEAFASGTSVQGGTNAATGLANEYELTLAEGTWTPTYRPTRMAIAGTGIEVTAREDGSGYDAGDDSLSASGVGEISGPGGAMYRVIRDTDGILVGTRFDRPIVGEPMAVDVQGVDNPVPKLSADDRDTDANEKGTLLEALGARFSVAELLDSGAATAAGPNIVAQARNEIAKIRDFVAQLVALYRDEGISRSVLDGQVDDKWDDADAQLATVFGSGTADRVGNSITLEREASPARVVAAFDRVVEALRSEEAFAAATLAGGPDAMQGFLERNAAQASAAFNRSKSTAAASLGALGSTRFGAATFNETDKAQSGFGDAERAQGFAWSTIEATRRASDVQTAGYGFYTGRTHAADQDGNLWSGAIDIEVRFARMAVTGLVTSLARADTQEPWIHGLGGEVTGIFLPTARLRRAGSWAVTDRSEANRGRLSFMAQAGGWPDQSLDAGSSFSGRLLGRGEAAGSEAIGTWQAVAGSTTFVGGFGATRGLDLDPPGAAVTGDFAAIGRTGDVRATLETGPAALGVVADDAGTTEVDESRAAVPVSTVINTGNMKFKYDPPKTDALVPSEYVDGAYEPQRATVLEVGEFKSTRGNWVADAREEITKKLAQLRRSIALDGADGSASDRTFANQQRQRLFNEIQAEIRKVFGPGRAAIAAAATDDPSTDRDETMAISEVYTGVLTRYAGTLTATDRWTGSGEVFHEDYPVNSSGVAQDAGVLAEIEDVLAAFADADAFADGFASAGLFAAVNADPDRDNRMFIDPYPRPSEMFERPRGKLSIVSAATDFTRFGAWSHQVSANAVSALSAQTYARDNRGREFGAFAYSPLDPTAAYTSTTSRLYPARGAAGIVAATYAGETVAGQVDLFYKGAVEATVFWDPATVADSKIRVTISDLAETETGDTLQFGHYVTDSEGNVGPGIAEVGSLTWTANIETDEGVVKFSSSGPVRVAPSGLGAIAFKPAYDNQLRFRFSSGVPHSYQFGSAADTVALRGSVSSNYGALNLNFVRQGGSVLAPTPADRTQFALDQAMLRMPKWVIAGPTTNTSTSSSNASPTWIFVFADGSMLQYGNQHGQTATLNNPTLVTSWRRAIGIDPNKNPASLYATDISGDPELSANDGEHLFTRPGSADARGYPTAGGTNVGVGLPSMSPSELYAAYLAEGGYNVDVGGDTAAALASELEGMFVGQDADGPLGIIGNWSLSGDAFGVGETRGPIRGAFGADFQP